MSGTQLSSHGEEGEEAELRRRMRGDYYSKSPAQSPRKTRVREKENVAEKEGLCGRLQKTQGNDC